MSARTLFPIGAAAAAAAVIAGGSGPPPPPSPDPPAYTVVAHGRGSAGVRRPARLTNRSIERAVQVARARALPRAVAAARREAAALAAAAGLAAGRPIAIARDTAPWGWGEPDSGRFGPGRWCGRIYRGRDARPRFRYGCQSPPSVSTSVTLTLAATPRGG